MTDGLTGYNLDPVSIHTILTSPTHSHYTKSTHHQGAGTDGNSYYMGDWIAQVPCGPVNTCPLLSQMSDTDGGGNGTVTISSATMQNDEKAYAYTALGGAVDFGPADMPNTETWAMRSDVTSLRYSPVASHVCSYACFLARAVGDPQDHCVFTLEWGSDVPMANRCSINY